ncbi:hypothetical protein D3C78_1658840 [compost metagenome]
MPLESVTIPRETRITERIEKIATMRTRREATATMISSRLRASDVEIRSSFRLRATASPWVSVTWERSRETV